jgi:hypothetical protein
VSVVEWSIDERTDSAKAALGARGLPGLVRKLRSRLLHGRDFMLVGREKVVALTPADESGWETDGEDNEVLVLKVTPDAVRAMMRTLRPVRGAYAWPELPRFALTVVPSEITNPDGEVIEVIG